jgi:hypothetical protein
MPKYDIDKILEQQNKQIADLQIKSQSQPPPPQVSKTESALRGGAQGVSFGFADEATARLESIMKGVPYEQALEESRQAYRQAQEANPITYTGSEIAGGILPALIPTGATQVQAGASLGRLALIGAGTGALSGLGYSEGQDIGQVAKDVGIGGLLGGSLPVLGRGVQSAIQGVKPAIDTSIKSGLSAMTGKTLPYLEKVESQPERIKKIERIFTGTGKEETQKLANDITDLVKKDPFGRKASLLSNRAYKVLEKDNEKISISKEDVLNNLKNIATEFNTTSDVDELTLKALNKKIKKIDQVYPETLNGLQSKKLIKEIDKDIKALTPKVGEQRQLPIDAENRLNLFKTIRSEIDVPLKQQSVDYKEAMKPVSDATNVSEYLQKLTVSQYGGKEASAKKAEEFINSKLRQNSLTPLEAESRTIKLMGEELKNPRYNNYPGINKLRDVNQTIADLKLLQEIQATGAIGSSVTNRMLATGVTAGGGLGTMIGGIAGGTSGATMGGTIGSTLGTLGGALIAPKMEREGGRFAAKVLEKTKGIRTPTAIPESTQRGFATQQGLQKPLIDQFLSDNASEVRRKQEMKSKFEQDNRNRVK